ncbi:glycosyltransferase family 2 protein [Candidatus Microgenomates bacterium]|nr:glycosyltransferase family 2 protein [Candidatus Microgenomates bacterium]
MEKRRSDHFVSIIIPIYKQEKTIVRNLRHIKTALDNIKYDYEIIAVVDGMIDNSLKIIKKANIPKLKTIAYIKNQGKAYAIRLGMSKAKGDYVMFMDSGMEIHPNGISMLLEHMEWYNADVIVGSKRHAASQVKYPAARKVLSYGYYYLVKFMFSIKVKDTQAGIKIFRKKTLETILPRLKERQFAGDLEILVAADTMGFTRIYEAPIKLDYHLASVTSAATLKAIQGIIMDTLAIYYRKNFTRHYHKSARKVQKKQLKLAKTR